MPESRGPSHNVRRTGLSHPHWKELLRGSDLFDMPAQFSIGNKTLLKRVILVRAYQIACPSQPYIRHGVLGPMIPAKNGGNRYFSIPFKASALGAIPYSPHSESGLSPRLLKGFAGSKRPFAAS